MPVHDPEQAVAGSGDQFGPRRRRIHTWSCASPTTRQRRPYVRAVLDRAAADPRVQVVSSRRAGRYRRSIQFRARARDRRFRRIPRPRRCAPAPCALRDGRVSARPRGRGPRVLGRGQAACRMAASARRHSSRSTHRTACSARTTSTISLSCGGRWSTERRRIPRGFRRQSGSRSRAACDRARATRRPRRRRSLRMAYDAGSTAIAADRKPLAQEAGRHAVDDALRRRGVDARVDFGPSAGLYMPRYTLTGVTGCRRGHRCASRCGRSDGAQQMSSERRRMPNRTITIVRRRRACAEAINSAARAADRRPRRAARRVDARHHTGMDPADARAEPARRHRRCRCAPALSGRGGRA